MRVYLSSTLNDLKPERDAVKEGLSGHHVVVESYDADEGSVRDSCLADVASCDLYVGIVGLRYGFIPPGETKSITELEFDAASTKPIRRLLFIKDPAAISATDTDSHTLEHDPAQILAFRNRLSSGQQGIPRPAVFSTVRQLIEKLLRALLKWQEANPMRETGITESGDVSSTDGGQISSGLPGRTDEAPPALRAGASEMQTMLWRHLIAHWAEIHDHPLFLSADVIANCPRPLVAQAVFDAVIDADCEDVLDGLRNCFLNPSPGTGGAGIDRRTHAYQALSLIALVAAEQFVLAQREELDRFFGAHYEPIPGREPVLAAVLAAALFRFGLHFKSDHGSPLNVVYVKPPQAELGSPGEEGPSLFRKELVAAANRIELGSEYDLTGMESVSDRRVQRLIKRVADRLECSVALNVEATGVLSASQARKDLLDDMQRIGVRAFFTPSDQGNTPHAVRELLSDLKSHLSPFFFPATALPSSGEQAMSKNESSPASATSSTTITIGTLVGNLTSASAPGAVAAGRDVIQAPAQVPDVLGLLVALRQAIDANLLVLASPEQRASFAEYIEDIRGVVEKKEDARLDSEARLVKRCLDGLKKGAEGVENGSTIVEKLTPLWDGLKATWPAFAALFS